MLHYRFEIVFFYINTNKNHDTISFKPSGYNSVSPYFVINRGSETC